MTMRVEHELHRRRFSRNIGLGIVLVAFVFLVYGLTVAKMGTDPMDALTVVAPAKAPIEPPALTQP
ncbi:MAG: hypothetical protein P8X50_02420 [Maritimibacter sp.]|jgi:hypothetical protein